MDDIGETLWMFIVLTACIFLVVGLGLAFLFLGGAVLVAGVPVGLGYWWYHNQHLSAEAKERQAHERTWKLYKATKARFTAIDIPTFIGKQNGFPDDDDTNANLQFKIAALLVAFENLDDYPPEPPEICDSVEGGRYRDFLNQVSPEHFERRLEHICMVATLCKQPVTKQNVANVIYAAVQVFEDGRSILPVTTRQLNENYQLLKETTLEDYTGDDMVGAYLGGTAMELMGAMYFDQSIDIPHDIRNQHHAIIAGTGHGKTQCLQQMLLKDFEEDDACVIVIDSQGGMLEKLLHVVSWDRCMYLDGGNIHQPLALSAFSIGSTSRPEDEPKVRTAVALYEHMFAARETALTTTQSTLYRFLSRFLMVIPNANFDTALEILQDGYEPYADYIDQLDETSQKFVTTQLCDPKDKSASQSYRTTRQEVARRLFTLMESRTLKGMFNAPMSKVDIGQAIRDRRIILINTAQAVLGDEGAQLFGKYCFAQIAIEILARSETKDRVYLYLDEAQEYLSDSPIIRRLYEQGRKRGLCMITACQELDQLERAGIDRMINSLTSIKFAGGVSAGDAGKLAKEMDTDAETIRGVPALTFAAWIKHHDTGVYNVTPGLLEDRIAAEPDDSDTLKHMMINRYHYDPRATNQPEVNDAGEGEAEDTDFDSYWDDEPSPDTATKSAHRNKPPGDGEVDPDAPQELD